MPSINPQVNDTQDSKPKLNIVISSCAIAFPVYPR